MPLATVFSGNIISQYIANGAVRFYHMGSGAINQFSITSGALKDRHFSSGVVKSGSIASGQIGANHIASGVINSGVFVASGTVQSGSLANESVVSGSIASGQIGTTHLASGTISTNSGQIINQTRISTVSGFSNSSITTSGVQKLYLVPFNGNQISLYDGTKWKNSFVSGDISINLSGMTTDKIYDVLCYENSGIPTLALSNAWTDDNTRADEIFYQDNIPLFSGNLTRRLVGTIKATSATTTENQPHKRYVVNFDNRVRAFASRQNDTVYSGSLNSGETVAWGLDSENKISFLSTKSGMDGMVNWSSDIAKTNIGGSQANSCLIANNLVNMRSGYPRIQSASISTSYQNSIPAVAQYTSMLGYNYIYPETNLNTGSGNFRWSMINLFASIEI